MRQSKERYIDQLRLRERLPDVALYFDAGRENIFARTLRRFGYDFHNAYIDMATSPAAGINGKLVPQKGGVLNINVLSTMGISEAAAESEARAFLPAHLSLVFDFGKNTWDAQDAAGSSWNVLDLRNKTWNALDVL